MASRQKTAEDLLAIFDRQNPDGTYVYKDYEIRAMLRLLVLLLANSAPVHPMPPPIAALMDELAVMAGVPEDASQEQIQAAVDQYYAQNPIEPRLLADFQAFVQEVIGEEEAAGA